MVVKILVALAGVAAVLAILIARQPDTFRVERSVDIAAPPERAYAQVADFHQWATWSPWEKLDPDMKRTYSGEASGTGAAYAWAGTKAGEGRMSIENATPPSRIDIKLEFIKPFAATNHAAFVFDKTASGARVTWSMEGKNNFLSKAFHLVMNMDKMVGGDFEKGLAAMRANAERAPQVAAAGN